MRCLIVAAIVAAFSFSVAAVAQVPTLNHNDAEVTRAVRAAPLLQIVRAAHRRNVTVFGGGDCSGVIVDTNRVVTARHCYDESKPILVNGVPARLVRLGVDVDLALLEVPTDRFPRAPWHGDVSLAEEVFVVGNVGSRIGTVKFGRVSFVHASFIDVDAAVGPGMSGGGVWSIDGRLAGILVNSYVVASPGPRSTAFVIAATCVPAKQIMAFVLEARR